MLCLLWLPTLAARAAFATRLSQKGERDLRAGSESGYAVVVKSHHTSTTSFALWRRVGAASERDGRLRKSKAKQKGSNGRPQPSEIELRSEGKKVSTPTQSIIASKGKAQDPT